MSSVFRADRGADSGILQVSVESASPPLFGGTGEVARELVEIGQLPFDLLGFGSSVADRSAQHRGAACEALAWDGRARAGGRDGPQRARRIYRLRAQRRQ